MKLLQKKPTKTISGVAPLAVMLPPRKCKHGACLYCPKLNAPQSYTPESPAVLRAKSVNYSPEKQVLLRLKMFKDMNHPTDKIELIIMGGTFLQYPEKFQNQFIKSCYDSLNSKKSKTLEQAKKLNEKAKHRCVALCIETRPDVCDEKQIKKMLSWGATRVELGVQAIDDKIYKKINRGHTVQDVIDATKNLKQAGFKIGYHIMPGLYSSNEKKDTQMFKKIFSSQDFKPDQIKIYPCQVLKGAGLENLYYGGEYIPYTKEQTEKIIIKFLKLTPEYCRVMRIMREIPPAFLTAGIKNIDLRKDIEQEIRKQKIKIKEIRFREIGFALRDKKPNQEIDTKIKIKKSVYNASDGKEIFLQAVNKNNILFGLCRLRLNKSNKNNIYKLGVKGGGAVTNRAKRGNKLLISDKVAKNAESIDREAIIRELHIYGPALKLKQKGKISQHKGLGKKLLKTAEQIAKKHKTQKLKIISGVGVREYYKKLNYTLDKEGIYMEKSFE
ncbi:tRNA uridine(34) 5-carboxymethylaminomethyl modification radical SAM/GNAT enzyme Elp3 [Candidatus Pacearchaeota archaeon]|nr:tRNA uridine(34) 5-carboxymethylaminomethyl modification radical SAM/GNAT enzyme Elp3 [Candidatus Pacearchaeota archaeon]